MRVTLKRAVALFLTTSSVAAMGCIPPKPEVEPNDTPQDSLENGGVQFFRGHAMSGIGNGIVDPSNETGIDEDYWPFVSRVTSHVTTNVVPVSTGNYVFVVALAPDGSEAETLAVLPVQCTPQGNGCAQVPGPEFDVVKDGFYALRIVHNNPGSYVFTIRAGPNP